MAASASRVRSAAPRCSGVRRAENEFNYCATCQTGGRLLADRVMSRLLRKKYPRTLKAAEERRRRLGIPESGPSRGNRDSV